MVRVTRLQQQVPPSEKPKNVLQPKYPDEEYLIVGDTKIAAWGNNNDFPSMADQVISSVGVLNTGLKFTRNFTLGQSIFACTVTDFDESGNEVLSQVKDKSLITFANSRLVRRFMSKALRDYLKFGCAFVQVIMNADGSKVVGINTINAKYCRLSIADQNGVIQKCVVSGKWPDSPGQDQFQVFDVLDEYDPFADLQRRRWAQKTAGKSFIFVIRDSWESGEYYSSAIWWAVYLAGWIDIAKKVPSFLKKAYENQITWKWHIQIPYAFWDKQFPAIQFATTELRKAAIESYMDSIKSNLCGTENADKPIFTFFDINPQNGKAEEQWIIKPLENKLSNEQNLVTSAAANSEIMFSIMVNPNVLGAGMPGGTYAGNQGGSNIREAYLVNIANCWLDRQDLLDVLELFIRYNGAGDDVEWRFRNTILTTLDTGADTTKTLS
ncbi:MAG TPA: hypothetical protein VFC67_22920 [Prolixibacteraceae bacterium]|nr:hypothetical protein [Prolixibacteraceae bacterium]